MFKRYLYKIQSNLIFFFDGKRLKKDKTFKEKRSIIPFGLIDI